MEEVCETAGGDGVRYTVPSDTEMREWLRLWDAGEKNVNTQSMQHFLLLA